jgi:hypothetical protein
MYRRIMHAVVLLIAIPVCAVETFKISDYGDAHQIWFEVEDFDERNPTDDRSFVVTDEPGAFGRSISSVSASEGNSMIRYSFDISKAGGSGGIWYFWGRVINPNNNSDFMLVHGHAGDQVPFTLPVSGLVHGQRVFEQSSLGTDWVWAPTADSAGEEAHTKTLKDGENTMYVLARESGATWDVFMWTDDPNYVPTDEGYKNATATTLGRASRPSPTSGAIDVPRDDILTWTAGASAVNHDVYFGTSFDDVNAASVADPLGVLASEGQDANSYAPETVLAFGQTYYWRVDEVNGAPDWTVIPGEVWSFTTPAYRVVDDFDLYDNDCLRIFFAWVDSLGHSGGEDIEGCDVAPSNGNGSGSIVGNASSPFAEQTIANAGSTQSMPFYYDNAAGPSEATLTFNGQDWSVGGVQTLSLAFSGTEGNTGTLYIKINNTKLIYDLDPTDIARSAWQTWNIDLSAMSNLQNVTSLTIGVDGVNVTGMLYIDDIRLYALPGQLITPEEPEDTGLLTYLSFDEGAGTEAGDASGNGHDCTLVGPPQWAAGKVGAALQFGNGSHVLDDDAADYLNGLEALTVCMWIKSSVIDTDKGVLICRDPNGSDNSITMRYDAAGSSFGGTNLLKMAVTTDSAEQQLESSSSLQTTGWQHISMTWQSDGLLRSYVDGIENTPTGRSNPYNNGPVSTCEKLIIGKGGKDQIDSVGWDGLIDEVRIYGRVLSAEEILWLAGRTESVHRPL